MNTDVAFQIVELALALAKGQPGDAAGDVLVQIIGKAMQAYQANTGRPLDQSLIKAEDPV